jgi:hypothetical protein
MSLAEAPDRLAASPMHIVAGSSVLCGYVVEGHVPAGAIRRLLAEKPQAIGLAVPGMPVGSPGMETGAADQYEVVLFGQHGRRVFARYLSDRKL